jgi:hypothetical protein
MKTGLTPSIIIALNMFLSLVASSQVLTPDQVPVPVRQGFQAKFPAVKQTEWKLKSDKNYEAEFTLKATEIAAKFDSAGKWLETETAISASQVPKAVRKTAAKTFKDYKIIERQSVQCWDQEHLIYELHLENAKEIVKAQFAAEGTVLRQSAKPKPEKGK